MQNRTVRSPPVIAAVAIVAAVIAADLIVPDDVVLVGLLGAAPLLCGVTASPRATRFVAALAVATAALSPLWNDSWPTWRYWIPLTIVGLAAAFAVLMARYRAELGRDARRMQVLADIANAAAHGELEVVPLAQRIADLLVPRLVDVCVIDVLGAGDELQRIAGALDGGPQELEALMRRPPPPAPAATQHRPTLDDDVAESAIVVPLIARERNVGVLTLGTRAPRPRLGGDDVEYAETLSGRVALALDNARLSAELSSAERQLETILATIDAAIMARDVHGRLVYANQAAADLLKVADPQAIHAASSTELMERFDVYTEEGDPVALDDLPGTRVLRGELDPPAIIVRNVVRATGEERWLLNKASPVTGRDGRVLMAVNLIEDITETKRSEIAQRLLARAAHDVAEAEDLPRTLQVIADAAVPGLADWAGVDLVDGRGRITTVAVAHRDPAKVALGWRLRTTWPVGANEDEGLAAVVRTGEPQLMRDITDEMLQAGAHDAEHLAVLREVGLTSTMIVPIRAGARILGAMSFVSSTSRRFDDRDLRLALDLGRQAGIFISNARLHAEQALIAHTLQAGLIPEVLPHVEGWDVATAYRAAGAANEVGGDFYDVVRFPGGWAAVIGDVVGKGAQAAALTALARHTLAAIIESTGDPGHALAVLNRRLRERAAAQMTLCTIAIVAITRDDRAAVYCAGHPLPILVRDGEATPLGESHPLLGVFESVDIAPVEVDLVPGDQIVLYTDGVLDAVGDRDRFGEERLLAAAAGIDRAPAASSGAAQLLSVIEDFVAGDQTDDIAIMSLARAVVASRPVRA